MSKKPYSTILGRVRLLVVFAPLGLLLYLPRPSPSGPPGRPQNPSQFIYYRVTGR